MTPAEMNQFIHEKIMGKCFHAPNYIAQGYYLCSKCKQYIDEKDLANPDYTQWEHYGPMLEEINSHKRFPQFIDFMYQEWPATKLNEPYGAWLYMLMSDPTRGCQAIVEFFGKEM